MTVRSTGRAPFILGCNKRSTPHVSTLTGRSARRDPVPSPWGRAEGRAGGDGTRGCRGGRRRAQRAGRGGVPGAGRAGDGGLRAARGTRRGGGQRASVRAGVHGDVPVVRGLPAAARPGPRPAARPAWLPRVPAGALLRAAPGRAVPAAAGRSGAPARRDRQVLRAGRGCIRVVFVAPGGHRAGAGTVAAPDP